VAWTLLLSAAAVTSALADTDPDRLAITQRLQSWTTAFNARDAAATCDLFAPDLIATFRGGPDRGRDAVCQRIADALAQPGVQLHNALDIREIIVAGDLAVVRVVWTATIREGTSERRSVEPGIDIFKRQGDGRWSIIRYLAFSTDRD
jgi:steroid delta-isomerase